MSQSSDVPGTEEALAALDAHLSVPALIAVASSLRHNITCVLASSSPAYGASHAVYCLVFSDGVRWAAKFGLIFDSEPASVEYLCTEAAFLLFAEKSLPSLPVPRMHAFEPEGGDVGLPYILMSWVEGQTVNLERESHPIEVRYKILDQVSKFVIDLTYDSITPPCDAWGAPHSAAMPGSSVSAFYKHHLDRVIISRCRAGSITGPCEVSMLDMVVLRSLVDDALPPELEHGPFPIHHSDLRWGNIFWDEDFNLVGVIDWSSRFTAVRRPLITPALLHLPEILSGDLPYYVQRLQHHEALYFQTHPDAPRPQPTFAALAARCSVESGLILRAVCIGWEHVRRALEIEFEGKLEEAARAAGKEVDELVKLYPELAASEVIRDVRKQLSAGIALV